MFREHKRAVQIINEMWWSPHKKRSLIGQVLALPHEEAMPYLGRIIERENQAHRNDGSRRRPD